MSSHITVVYTINDEASAKDELEQLGQRYQAYDPENPPAIGISAMSNANEMRRLELIEDATDEYQPADALEKINGLLGALKLPE